MNLDSKQIVAGYKVLVEKPLLGCLISNGYKNILIKVSGELDKRLLNIF